MKVVALTEADSWFARRTDLPQLPLATVTARQLAKYDLAVLCPERHRDQRPEDIIAWKALGMLPRTRLCFATYKGLQYWKPSNEAFVERWVVHTRSEIERTGSRRMTFIPLTYDGTLAEGPGAYMFCGGRKERDFALAAAAADASGLPAIFVSDLLPKLKSRNKQIQFLRRRIPVEEYR